MENNWHNCTMHNCNRPVFCLTLCRGCYRGWSVRCNVPLCHRPSFCKQACLYHYRRKELPPLTLCTTNGCEKVAYIGRCFKCYTSTTCLQCNRISFARNLCQQHYMVIYRQNRLNRQNRQNLQKE